MNNNSKKTNIGIILSLLSALLSAFNIIIEKKYIKYMSSEKILFLMYMGAGIGLFIIHLLTKNKKKSNDNKITKKDIPSIMVIVICELGASFFLIEALKRINASLASLLIIFELVMTSICSCILFKNKIEKNEIIAIVFVLIGSFILNFKEGVFNNMNLYSLLVILACICWGISNNVTALLSSKEPSLFTSIKCISVSVLYFIILLMKKDISFNYPILVLLGFFTYGISILSYAISTKYLGASKATLVFSFSPIFGAILAIIIYKETITMSFIISAILMIIGIMLMNKKDN